jgi:CBS domain-containing protein
MTPFPYSIGLDATLSEALALMAAHDIRHLPVTEAHALLGIVTERDISLLRGASSAKRSDRPLKVRDVYVADPYVVDLDEPLDNVLLTMAVRHIGSALVTRKGRLAGVFTATDACRTFGRFLREHYPPAGGDAA